MQFPMQSTDHSNRCILITGASGFIGAALYWHFLKAGWRVVGVSRKPSAALAGSSLYEMARFIPLTLPDPVIRDLLEEYNPAIVVHAAGSADVAYSFTEPFEDFDASARTLAYMLDSVRASCPAAHFIYLSSAAVYGNPESLPISEVTPTKPISPYGFHKIICETMIEEYSQIYGLSSAVLRIFSAYGPNMARQVMFDLSRRFIEENSGEICIRGEGTDTRDFIHISDLASIIQLLGEGRACGRYNVGSGEQTTVSYVAGILGGILAPEKKIIFDGCPSRGFPSQWCADISRLRNLGFHPQKPITNGLEEFATWFQKSIARQTHKTPSYV